MDRVTWPRTTATNKNNPADSALASISTLYQSPNGLTPYGLFYLQGIYPEDKPCRIGKQTIACRA